MIVGIYFKGDCNEELKWIQHNEYHGLIGELYRVPRERYIKAVNLVGVRSLIYERGKTIKSFDHRVLQMAHDIIAAFYRYKHDGRGQIPLFLREKSYHENLIESWRKFYFKEVNELTETRNDFVRAVLEAVCFENTDSGYVAEDELFSILGDHYSCQYWISDSFIKSFEEMTKAAKREENTVISKDEAARIIKKYMAIKDPNICQLSDKLPNGCKFYETKKDEYWFALCPPKIELQNCISPGRLIVLSQKSGKIIFDGSANNEG